MPVKGNYRLLIFLIADEPIVIETLQELLNGLGHEVVTFNSTKDVFDDLERASQPIDIILIELKMTKGEDIKIIKELHQRYPEADIIIMTDCAPIISSRSADSDGVYACLNIPFRLVELELLMRLITEGRADFRYIPYVAVGINRA
ncbi:MAG: response regulator [Deltaproteobacteria bacterium]|nr:MAG: response regulator [Deltaproteobacteria bacterium]